MAALNLPSPDQLRQLLRYEPSTGKLYWLERDVSLFDNRKGSAEKSCRTWNTRFAGKEAFATDCHGYGSASVFGRKLLAHRVAWAVHYGAWPSQHIDHINGDRVDNRISNLRNVSQGENTRNAARRFDNTSGHNGVTWNRADRRWVAQIQHKRKMKYIGGFIELEDAVAARRAAEAALGFHENHGRT